MESRHSEWRSLWIAGLGAIALTACGETPTLGAGGSGGEGGSPDATVSHSLRVFELEWDEPPFEGAPIEDALVCELDTDNCVTTDEDGIAVIAFPRNEEIAFTVEKRGYGSWIFANVTDESFQVDGTAALVPEERLAEVSAALGTTFPWPAGMVGLQRWPSMAGVRFLPVGPAVDAVGEPFYFDKAAHEYTLELDATTFSLLTYEFPFAQGGFTDVTPGVWQFEMAGAAGDCTMASWCWPGDAPNRLRIPVRAGYVTYGGMVCED